LAEAVSRTSRLALESKTSRRSAGQNRCMEKRPSSSGKRSTMAAVAAAQLTVRLVPETNATRPHRRALSADSTSGVR
jgi:hypothetical protein